MITEPCLVCTEPSWLDDYRQHIRSEIEELEKECKLPFKYHRSRCEDCGLEVLMAVEDPYMETRDGRVAVMLGGRYVLLSDEYADEEDLP